MGFQIAFKVFILVVVTYNLCIIVKEFLVRKTCNKEIEAVVRTVDNKRIIYSFEENGCIYTIPGNVVHLSMNDVPFEDRVKIKINDNRTWCCDGKQSVIINLAVVALGIMLALWSLL